MPRSRVSHFLSQARLVFFPQALHETQGFSQELRGFDVRSASTHSEEGMNLEDMPSRRIGTVAHQDLCRVKKMVFA